jgi:hypothetical protein
LFAVTFFHQGFAPAAAGKQEHAEQGEDGAKKPHGLNFHVLRCGVKELRRDQAG